MVCLPDASWDFLTPPETFGHFLMLHYTSYCFMLLVGSSWTVFIAFFTRLPQHKNLEIMKSGWILKWAQPDPPKKLMQWKKNLPGTFWHLPGTTRHVLNCVGILQLPGKPEIVLTIWSCLDSQETLPGLYPVKAVDIEEWDTECWGALQRNQFQKVYVGEKKKK